MSATATKRKAKRPVLRPEQARELVKAQATYDRRKREMEKAKTVRDETLTRLLPKFEIGEWVTVGGWAIRVTMQRAGQRFKLSDFLEKHKLTVAMKPFVTEGGESPRLWIKPRG